MSTLIDPGAASQPHTAPLRHALTLRAALEIVDRDGTPALTHTVQAANKAVNPEETELRLGLHRLPLQEFPVLHSLAPDLAIYDGAAELEGGLDISLAGLHLYPPAQPGS